MTWEEWALLFSFVAMLLIAASYFVKNKSGFLLFQSSGHSVYRSVIHANADVSHSMMKYQVLLC